MSEKDDAKMGFEVVLIVVIVATGVILLLYNIWMFALNKSRSRNQSTDIHLHITNTNSSPNSQIPNIQTSNNLSPEFIDPLPLYTPPANPSHVHVQTPSNEHSSIQIQVYRSNNELIGRPPTYRV